MSEDICFEALLDIFIWIILSVLIEICVAILMSMGYSRGEAEGMVTTSACLLFLVLIVVYELLRRKKLGKSVVLDTDGDGEISEEEWAAAGQGEQEVDSGPEQSEGDSGGDGEWWQDKES